MIVLLEVYLEALKYVHELVEYLDFGIVCITSNISEEAHVCQLDDKYFLLSALLCQT